jgi:uncharacterized protein (DUF1501 family)
MDRRSLLKGCKDFMLSRQNVMGMGLDYFLGKEEENREMLIVVFLRGGMDGLNLLAPVDDPFYRAARGGMLGVLESGSQSGLRINQTVAKNDFRLHPSAGGLKDLYENKSLAFIHASGLINGTRSHFEAQDLMDLGSSKDKNLAQGWLTRYLKTFHSGVHVPAFAIGNVAPASLLGSMDLLNLTNIKDLKLDLNSRMMKVLSGMYEEGSSLVHQSGKGALDNIEHLKAALSDEQSLDHYAPDHSAEYPSEWPGQELANSFKTVAQLIKMDIGLKVATVDFDGWDMHDGQEGRFKAMTNALSRNIAAFYNDIHNYHKKTTIVVMTEFGRRLKANNNGGTDHGYGGLMMVLGGNVKGGKMYGKWPGLSSEQLDKGVDLAITTDYRNVLTEILLKRKLTSDYTTIFPKFNTYASLDIMEG